MGDVLEFSLAEIDERGAHLALDLAMGLARDRDAARLGGLLQTCRHVHAVAEDIGVLNYDVAEVDADSEYDSLILARGHGVLDGDGAVDGIDDAGELDQEPVAHRLDDAPVVLGDFGIEHLDAAGLEAGERTGLVGAHEPAVADRVGAQDGGKSTLGHVVPQVA